MKKCPQCHQARFTERIRVIRRQEKVFRGVGGPPVIAELIELSWECSACGHVGKSLEQLPQGNRREIARSQGDRGAGFSLEERRPKKTVSRKVEQLPEGEFVRYVGKVV